MRIFLFCILILISKMVQAQLTIEDVYVVSNPPEVLRQYNTPWCYAFSTKALIQQAYCKVNSCTEKKSTVSLSSILEVNSLNMVNASSPWFSGGSQDEVLSKLSSGVSIIRSSCAMDEQLMKFHIQKESNPMEYSLEVQLQIVFSTFQNDWSFSNMSKETFLHQWIKNYTTTIKYSVDLFFLQRALAHAVDLESFIREVIISSDCGQRILELPRFQIHKFFETTSIAIIEKINEGLNHDAVISLSICAQLLKNQIDNSKICGAHAVSVIGRRTLCETNFCKLQFNIYDSSFFPNIKPEKNGTFWLDANRVAAAVAGYANRSEGINFEFQDTIQEMRNFVIRTESEALASKIEEEAKLKSMVGSLLPFTKKFYQKEFELIHNEYSKFRDDLSKLVQKANGRISFYEGKQKDYVNSKYNIIWVELI